MKFHQIIRRDCLIVNRKSITLFEKGRKIMKANIFFASLLTAVLCLISTGYSQVPQMMNYQGVLTDSSGNRLNGNYNMTFSVYDTSDGGTPLWIETQYEVFVDQGVFNVLLSIPDSVWCLGEDELIPRRYLGVSINEEWEMVPRRQIGSVPYAYLAAASATATGMADGDWYYPGDGTTPVTDYVYLRNDVWGIARNTSNQLYGDMRFSHTNLGVGSSTGKGGQNYGYCTVGGGIHNHARNQYATIGGGYGNEATGEYSFIGGGGWNDATGAYAFVGCGGNQIASGEAATIGGGWHNDATGLKSTVGGGHHNVASTDFATVGGGGSNTASGTHATVGGGYSNEASGSHATIAGGNDNTASGSNATVGGGYSNDASESYATIAGGNNNTASGTQAAVGGGHSNDASGSYATIAGGNDNTASGEDATVGGGVSNIAGGNYATVGGGSTNRANGDYSFATGRMVVVDASADNTFAFGYNFTTSTPHAVIFYDASSPIRLGVQVKAPTHYIDVAGGAYCNGSQWVDASSRKYKKDIRSLTPGEYQEILQKLAQSEVVRYRYKSQDDDEFHIGLIAEDAPEEMVDPERTGIPTGDAIGFLTAALKAQQREIEALKGELNRMKSAGR